MKKHFVIGVDWYGPYTREDAVEIAGQFFNGGLYLAIGKSKYERKPSLQYIGISTNNIVGRLKNHHKLPLIREGEKIWLGEISTAEASGRRKKFTPRTLDEAEWLHAYFLKLPLNQKKTAKISLDSVTVLNRWWKNDGTWSTPRYQRPHPDWPDMIEYLGNNYPVRLIWAGKRKTISPDELKEYGVR